ncbi:MAG: Na/Pi cotransporter family protein [Desulfobacterales bacterium]|nr:Na/Pi cotransporter family protein [Desulfobacterales bacterium]
MTVIFQTLGGLGLFLFGMKIMSEGLQKVAGKKMRWILSVVSNNRFIGCGTGILVTSIVQSSSATTVMLVSFVDAGLINLAQAIGIILGANIGTTVTAQLIAFKISAYALPAIAAGVFLKFFVGKRKWIYVGDVLLGFGLVFYGLATMKAGFAPLRHEPAFITLFTRFNADGPVGIFLCILAGTALTMTVQSSSATVGITMALASQGLLNFEASVALILGDNIGTTITAELASIGASINAHRTARAHTLFNVVGVFFIILIFPLFLKMVLWISGFVMHMGPPDLMIDGERPNIGRYIANSHTVFNVANAFFFLMFLPYLVKVATWLTPYDKAKKDMDDLHHIKYVDLKFVEVPSVALAQAGLEIIRMGEAVQTMYDDVIICLKERSIKQLSKWRKREDTLDILQREITMFLVRVMQGNISLEESREVRSLIRMTNNIERIGDATENIAELISEFIEQGLYLSDEALSEYEGISNEIRKYVTLVVDSIKREDKEIMAKAQELDVNVKRIVEKIRESHLIRLQSGVCTVDPGLIFVNSITAFERMGGFCFNISQAVAGLR